LVRTKLIDHGVLWMYISSCLFTLLTH